MNEPCYHDNFLESVGAPSRIQGILQPSQYHEAHFWDLDDTTEDDIIAILEPYSPLLREARIVIERPYDLQVHHCHVLLNWNQNRIVKYCDLATKDHMVEPWSIQTLDRKEWNIEISEFYTDGQSGLLVLGNNGDAHDASAHLDGFEAQERLRKSTGYSTPDLQHHLARPDRTIPPGITHKILAATSKGEFESRMKNKLPEIWYTRFPEISKYLEETYEWRLSVNQPLALPDGQANIPGVIKHWFDTALYGPNDGNPTKSLCIVGPSRTWKTTWAKSLGKHIICPGEYNVKSLRSAWEADYAIFKDIDIRYLPWKKFVGKRPYFRIWDKYETAAYVLWNIPAIFIYSEDPRLELHDLLRSYWDAHVTTVEIKEDLYVM